MSVAEPFPSDLLEYIDQEHPAFRLLKESHRHHLALMLWKFSNPAYRHKAWNGASFSSDSQEKLWGNRRTRNNYVADYFSVLQGGNLDRRTNAFTPMDFMGRALLRYLRSPEPIVLKKADGKRMPLPRSVILSRARSPDPDVQYAKHAVWTGAASSATVPINQAALEDFIAAVPNSYHQLYALRLLRLSRNTLCPGEIPVQYQQVGTGRLVEVLFWLQSTPREVLSAALTGFWDYDLKNAHFAILSQWGKRLGKRTPVVDDYSRNKAAIRQHLASYCGVSIDDIKESLLALMYGGIVHPNPKYSQIANLLGKDAFDRFSSDPFVCQLKDEIRRVGAYIVADMPRHSGLYGNVLGIFVPRPQKNGLGSLLSHALQGMEAKALKGVIAGYGPDILLPMHDGWVARHRLDCARLEALLLEVTGFELSVEETQHPKHPPDVGGHGALWFADSTPAKPGGLIISASPQWSQPNYIHARYTRTDLK